MDTAFGALRTTAMIFVVVAISFGVYLHQLARITASTAAVAAATAATRVLDDSDWDCTETHTGWTDAEEAAARAAAARTGARSAATATGYTLSAEPSCTVVATVTVGAAGVRRWLVATAVACRPSRAADLAGWVVAPPC
ncbi:MAG: hypothetical protein F4Y99_00155 [Acidimicrobiaceae bacterium]|nr:hypothetical protein [Acidimicrobiaceae bacterium]MCY3650714.1 hypothetical protein [Acidimicrobiaceae bacterium]MDE0516198.1 hypothetical protein [Acidimicrobiaceae bacterium]MDE0655793.1 hypothetical protein [Acidimicrobiaceae bacterium]MXZ94329.1 hypothetical protein [Acidimicrobiaceae bacterium]